MQIDVRNIKAAIFDMDGTMVNNMDYHKKAWKIFCSRYGIDLTDEAFHEKISGKKNSEIFTLLFGKTLSLAEEAKYTEEKEQIYREIYGKEVQEITGLKKIINELHARKILLGIATTASAKNRIFILEKLAISPDLFSVILGDEDVTKGKPDPEIYLKAAQMLHISPAACLVFEDSPAGVMAAKNAGTRVVGILSTHTKEELQNADYTIEHFSQITFL